MLNGYLSDNDRLWMDTIIVINLAFIFHRTFSLYPFDMFDYFSYTSQ